MIPRTLPLVLAAAVLAACAGLDSIGGGAPRAARGSGPKIAIRTVINKSQQPTLEDALGLAVRDEFLRDARYPVTTEADAKYVLAITITRYTVLPAQYDATLAPSVYKLRILVDATMLNKATNKPLWTEKDLEGSFTYPALGLLGGMDEPQVQGEIWSILAPTIVERAAEGFSALPAVETSSATAVSPSSSTAVSPGGAPAPH